MSEHQEKTEDVLRSQAIVDILEALNRTDIYEDIVFRLHAILCTLIPCDRFTLLRQTWRECFAMEDGELSRTNFHWDSEADGLPKFAGN